MSLLKADLSVHKFDIVCLSETYLDPSVPLHDVNLEIQGCELVRSDHLLGSYKRGRVCICFINSLPLKILNFQYLRENVSFKLQVLEDFHIKSKNWYIHDKTTQKVQRPNLLLHNMGSIRS